MCSTGPTPSNFGRESIPSRARNSPEAKTCLGNAIKRESLAGSGRTVKQSHSNCQPIRQQAPLHRPSRCAEQLHHNTWKSSPEGGRRGACPDCLFSTPPLPLGCWFRSLLRRRVFCCLLLGLQATQLLTQALNSAPSLQRLLFQTLCGFELLSDSKGVLLDRRVLTVLGLRFVVLLLQLCQMALTAEVSVVPLAAWAPAFCNTVVTWDSV